MITVNPITISSPTRFQVSFTLEPPFPQDEKRVAGDGKWSVVCGSTSRHSSVPAHERATVYTEGAHNIAPHDGEPVPCITWFYQMDVLTMQPPGDDPTFGRDTFMTTWDPTPHGAAGHVDLMWVLYTKIPAIDKAWRVEVNLVHGMEAEVRDMPYEPRRGCLFPWWFWPLPMSWRGRGQSHRHGAVAGTRWDGTPDPG